MSFSGLLPPGTQFDLFRGTAAMKQDIDDMHPTTLSHTIKVSPMITCFEILCYLLFLVSLLEVNFLFWLLVFCRSNFMFSYTWWESQFALVFIFYYFIFFDLCIFFVSKTGKFWYFLHLFKSLTIS